MKGGVSYHLKVDIRGAILSSDEHLKGVYNNSETGKTLSVRAARTLLLDELLAGKKFLPVGDCDKFDPEKGCLGHPSEEPDE